MSNTASRNKNDDHVISVLAPIILRPALENNTGVEDDDNDDVVDDENNASDGSDEDNIDNDEIGHGDHNHQCIRRRWGDDDDDTPRPPIIPVETERKDND
jgi:hypothetical protein